MARSRVDMVDTSCNASAIEAILDVSITLGSSADFRIKAWVTD